MKKSIYTAFVLLLYTSAACQMNPESLAHRMIQEYRSHASISFDIDYFMSIKFLSSQTDSTRIRGHVDIARNPEDTLLGGLIWLRLDSVPIEHHFTSSKHYIISHMNKVIFQDELNMDESAHFAAGKVYFLDPERLLSNFNDQSITVQLEEDEMNGSPAWRWTNFHEDNGDVKNIRENIWIRQSDLAVTRISFSANTEEDHLHFEWNLSNIQYNSISQNDMENRWDQFQKDYTLSNKKGH